MTKTVSITIALACTGAILGGCSLLPEKKVDDGALAYDASKSRALNLLAPYADKFNAPLDSWIGKNVNDSPITASDLAFATLDTVMLGLFVAAGDVSSYRSTGATGKIIMKFTGYAMPPYSIFGYVDAKEASDYNDAVVRFATAWAQGVAAGIGKGDDRIKAVHRCEETSESVIASIDIVADVYGCSIPDDGTAGNCRISANFEKVAADDLPKYNDLRLTNTPPVFGESVPAYRIALTELTTNIDDKFDWGHFLIKAADSVPKYSVLFAPGFQKTEVAEDDEDRPAHHGKFPHRAHLVIERGAVNHFVNP